jgi:4-carboxymuconolactone decarboxylase
MRVRGSRNRSFLPAALGVALLGLSVTTLAQQMPADLDPTSGARLPYPTRADLGEAGKRVADIFARGDAPETPVGGPLAFAAYNPTVAAALLDLHDGAVTQGSLAPDIRELAIIVACRETNYTFEWAGHARAAENNGVDASVIDVVRTNKPLTGVPRQYAAVIRFGREIFRDRRMSSETFAEAVELFGERGAMDLVAVMSTYAVSGFYAIAVDEHPPGQTLLTPLP